MATFPKERQIHASLHISRPDGVTWVDVTPHLTRAEVELGDVSGVGTGTSGVDGVVRRLTFTLHPDRSNIPTWPSTAGRMSDDVVADSDDVVAQTNDPGYVWWDMLLESTHGYAGSSFAPGDRRSPWNRFGGQYEPLLKSMREVVLRVATTPPGVAPGPTDWVTLFHGYLGDRISTQGSSVTCECRDLAKRLQNTYIETVRTYGSEAGTPAEAVIQQILDDNLGPGAVTLHCPVSPGFMVTSYQLEYKTVWDAIQEVAAQIGWFLGYRLDPATQEFKLTLMEPPRSKDASTADFVLEVDPDILVHQLDVSDADIRNVFHVTYRDRDTGKRMTKTVINEASLQQYGRRAMMIEEADTSLIDTAEEAEALGEAASSDLGDLTGTRQIEMPLLPQCDVFSGIVTRDWRMSDQDEFTGVESVRHTIDFAGGRFRTEAVGSSRIVGGHMRWLRMETRPGTPAYPTTPAEVIGEDGTLTDDLQRRVTGTRETPLISARFAQLPTVSTDTVQVGLSMDDEPIDLTELLAGAVGARVKSVVTRMVKGNWQWSQDHPPGVSGVLNDITHGPHGYVAVGQVDAMTAVLYRSPNGDTWQLRFNRDWADLTGVTYGPAGYLAVGYEDGIYSLFLRSTDGQTWTPSNGDLNEYLYGCCASPSLYVAVGAVYDGPTEHALVLTSSDGVTWTQPTLPAGAKGLWAVTYGDGLFVAVGNQGTILTSTNGTTWTKQDVDAVQGFRGVAYGDGVFVAVGLNGVLATSQDGVSWAVWFLGGSFTGITHGPDGFVAVGPLGAIAVSTDGGGTWTGSTVGEDSLNGCTYADDQYVLVGANGTVVFGGREATPTQETYDVGEVVSYTTDTITLSDPWTEDNVPTDLQTDYLTITHMAAVRLTSLAVQEVDDLGLLRLDVPRVVAPGSFTAREIRSIGGGSLVDDDGVHYYNGPKEVMRQGHVGGLPWGPDDAPIPYGRPGFWGDREAGLYLRGYAALLDVGYAEDEDVIPIPTTAVNPQMIVAAKEMLAYSPTQSLLTSQFVDSFRVEDGFKIKAKAVVRGSKVDWPSKANARGNWTYTQPQTAHANGKKGVFTDFILCRPSWFIGWASFGSYSARLWLDVTDEFDANGDPINWRNIRSWSRSTTGEGTLNWDTALEHYGQWAVRIRGQSSNPAIATYVTTGVASAGYRSGDDYLDSEGNKITTTDPANTPSGMSVLYFLFDRG